MPINEEQALQQFRNLEEKLVNIDSLRTVKKHRKSKGPLPSCCYSQQWREKEKSYENKNEKPERRQDIKRNYL